MVRKLELGFEPVVEDPLAPGRRASSLSSSTSNVLWPLCYKNSPSLIFGPLGMKKIIISRE